MKENHFFPPRSSIKLRLHAGFFISGQLFELDTSCLSLPSVGCSWRSLEFRPSSQGTKSECACPTGHNGTASCLLRHLSESYFIGLLIVLMLQLDVQMYPEVSLDGNIIQIRIDNDEHSRAAASDEAFKLVLVAYLLENVILWSGEVSEHVRLPSGR